MNQYQARLRLIAGEKVTHRHFLPGEYLHVVNGKTITEDGHLMPLSTYHPMSPSGAPEGWELFNPQKEEEK